MPFVQWILQNLDAPVPGPVLLRDVPVGAVVKFTLTCGLLFQARQGTKLWLTTIHRRNAHTLYRNGIYAIVADNDFTNKIITLKVPDLRPVTAPGFLWVTLSYRQLITGQYFTVTLDPPVAEPSPEVLAVLLMRRSLLGRPQPPRTVEGLQSSPLVML